MNALRIAILMLLTAQFNTAATAQTNKVLRASDHSAIAGEFLGHLGHRSDYRAAIAKKGLDQAFSDWLRERDLALFEKLSSAGARTTGLRFRSAPHLAGFDSILAKRPYLRVLASREGVDAAYDEWLRTERPGSSRLGKSAPSIASRDEHGQLECFIAQLDDRSDLRWLVSKQGFTSAFNTWVAREGRNCAR